MQLITKIKNFAYQNFLITLLVTNALILSLVILDLSQSKLAQTASKTTPKLITQQSDKSEVLSHQYQSPQIFISGADSGFSSGGMIALASTDEPAVEIGGYQISGTAEIALYEANENSLFNYLVHDEDGNQINKNPNISQFRFITTVSHILSSTSSRVPLPLEEKGIWYLKVKVGTIEADAFVLRSETGVLVKEGDDEFIFWGQNFKSHRSITDGNIKVFNLQNGLREIANSQFNNQGVAKTTLSAEADIALVERGSDRAIVPINLSNLNTGYNYRSFKPKSRQTKYFIFTDRPLYRPGDTVFFKSVLRDDDDVRYTIPAGEVNVKVFRGWQEDAIFEKNYPISADGTIDGQYELSEDARVGYYRLELDIPNSTDNSISFEVEYFRKPEYSIEVITPTTEVVAGDKLSVLISGDYFFGQPLAGQEVKYQVYSADFNEYQYLVERPPQISDEYRYSSWYGNKILDGLSLLNNKGEAEIELNTKLSQDTGKSQVFSVEAEFDDDTGNPSFSRKNILVHFGEFGIYRKEGSYGTKVNGEFSLPLTLRPHFKANVSNTNLTAKIKRVNWVSYQEPNNKYPSYREETEELPSISAKTDSTGSATFKFTPAKVGTYSFTVEAKDSRGNLISKNFYTYAYSRDQPFYTEGENEIAIQTDKERYLPTDTANFRISSNTPDRDVFLSLERERVNRFQIVHLNGPSTEVDVPLVGTDIPNIYAAVASFSNNYLDTNSTNVVVSPESKKLSVNLNANNQTFGPSETVTLDIQTRDNSGKPVSADVAVWAVDKAIFEISDNKLGDIFDDFWHERYNNTLDAHSLQSITVYQAELGGGCFAAGTPVLMANGLTKNIEQVKEGDYVLTRQDANNPKLVKAKVINAHSREVPGYLIINGNLKVTTNHIIRINNTWREAGSVQIGDHLINSQGYDIIVGSIEWQKGKFTVYNLEIENFHTYFAQGVLVHNQKGGVFREVFKDAAYWNPSVHTDSAGQAQVRFTLPDNLTTWAIAAVGATSDTKVGQTTAEIVVTKDVIVRPVLPNILRENDKIVLSALVQNFTNTDQTFDVSLKFDSGTVKQETFRDISIKSNDLAQLFWDVQPETENEKAKLVFSARSQKDQQLADIVTQEIAVKAFGFEETRAETGEGTKDYQVNLSSDSHREKSQITLSLAPTIIGTLPASMKYLINYPYGCVEQTTSRFVPAVIAKAHSNLFAEALQDKDIDDIIKKGVLRLFSLQQADGGWSWWYAGDSDPFITAYVVEYLLLARDLGLDVDPDLLKDAQRFLEQDNKWVTTEDLIAVTYALTLLKSEKRLIHLDNLDNLSPDILSLAIIANYLNGDSNPSTNGLEILMAAAKTQGDAVFWESGQKLNFGTQEASTAFAIRAILTAQGDTDIATKAVRFLTGNRRSNFWANTFATSQIIRALVDFSKVGGELAPNYTYTISLDNEEIAQGYVTNVNQKVTEIAMPAAQIKSTGSKISITKSGQGQVYSTLAISEFRTDRTIKAQEHGLSVKREFVNEKGSQFPLAVGDKAIVRITLDGLKTADNYAVIADELPSGLIPINESFRNQEYGYDPQKYYTSFDVSDREVTENGMVLSLYRIAPGQQTYTYKARVVSAGEFTVPPATASLMYSPEIYGRSEAQTITVLQESQVKDEEFGSLKERVLETLAKNKIKLLEFAVTIVLLIIAGIFVAKKRGTILKKNTPQSQDNNDKNKDEE